MAGKRKIMILLCMVLAGMLSAASCTVERDIDFFVAAANGNISALEQALGADTKVDAINEDGKTALLVALEHDQLEAAELLLENGSDPDTAMEIKFDVQFQKTPATALSYAAAFDKMDAARLLAQHGADLNKIGYLGLTPLANAAMNGNNDLAMWLVGEGADVNAVNEDRETALMAAVLGDNPALVRFLLENGADAAMRNTEGYTALTWAQEYELDEMVNLLQ